MTSKLFHLTFSCLVKRGPPSIISTLPWCTAGWMRTWRSATLLKHPQETLFLVQCLHRIIWPSWWGSVGYFSSYSLYILFGNQTQAYIYWVKAETLSGIKSIQSATYILIDQSLSLLLLLLLISFILAVADKWHCQTGVPKGEVGCYH